MTIKNILIVLALMGLLYGLNRLTQPPRGDDFSTQLFRIAPGDVTTIVMESRAHGDITLTRTAEKWIASDGRRSTPVAPQAMEALLANLNQVRTLRIEASREDQWPDFHLHDEKATQVRVLAGSKVLANFFIGHYRKAPAGQGLTTSIRLNSQAEVFAVEGLQPQLFTRSFEQYRNRQVLLAAPELHVTRFELMVADTLVFSFAPTAGQWWVNGQDSVPTEVVSRYLKGLQALQAEAFADDFDEVQKERFLHQVLHLYGPGGQEAISIACYRDSTRQVPYILWSAQQPSAWFASDTSGLYGSLFAPWHYLWQGGGAQ